MTKLLNETQFRGLVRDLITEYVSDDQNKREPNFNKRLHADPSARNWDSGLDESDEDHSETHGGKRVGDPRWEEHPDPTARNWDSGLDEAQHEQGVEVAGNWAQVGDAELNVLDDKLYIAIEGGSGYETYRATQSVPLSVIAKLLEHAGYTVTRK
jgi:hypothetical protein